jgi:serine/threonine protein kinase
MPFTAGNASTDSEFRFEHYQVLKNEDGTPMELGHGGMGVTYKAVDVHLQCPVALKIINARWIGDASARHRFVREARAAASVRHPNVASVFHLGESGGNYFYAMEFVDGETLEKVIRRSGRLQTDVALEVVAQIAAGLTAIQKQHLVHRDIKPSNIMVNFEDDRIEIVKIIDLGLAKGIAEESISTVGGFTGTPEYASPEQFAGVPTDIRSDLYSLGITLWEMLSGKLPFQGSPVDLIYQHQHAALPEQKLENAPAPVIALLQILLAKDAGERFQSPAGLQKALIKVKEAIAFGSRLTTEELQGVVGKIAKESPKEAPRKHPIRWWLSAAFGLLALLLGSFFILRHQGLFSTHRSTQSGSIEKSIAVLPFENISPNRDDAYFADGVQDEILNNLAKIAQLKVISRTSVMQYRADTKRDLRQIASALGVANVLEGAVRREGNHVRVSTELVDAHNDNTIWADSYDRDLTDIFAIQSEIAQIVAAKLSAQLSSEARQGIEETSTNDLEAYDLYLQAKELIPNMLSYIGESEREGLLNSINLLMQATRKDEKFALAYCLVAKANDILYNTENGENPERRTMGDAAISEAMRLRPDLPEVHLATALHLYVCYRDYQRARVQIAIAERELPNSSDAFSLTGRIDRRQGHWEESTKALEHAYNLDPRNSEIAEALAENYVGLRRYRNAEKTFERLIELESDKPFFRAEKAYAAFCGSADLASFRAILATLPPSLRVEKHTTDMLLTCAEFDRDWEAAAVLLRNSSNEEFYFAGWATVPAGCVEVWLALIQGEHPRMEGEFAVAREQLSRKVESEHENRAQPGSGPYLLSALGIIDAALGRKQEAIQEAKQAVEILPISEDSMSGPGLVENLAVVYAWTSETDLCFQQLAIAVNTPGGISYGELKLDPAWDPVRKDPRFEKLLAQLTPRD